MGVEPPVAVPATHPVPHSSGTATAHGRFAMPHAFVIATCIVTAAILAPREMTVGDVLLLIAGAGGIGTALVIAVVSGSRRVGRFVRAYLSSGN